MTIINGNGGSTEQIPAQRKDSFLVPCILCNTLTHKNLTSICNPCLLAL